MVAVPYFTIPCWLDVPGTVCLEVVVTILNHTLEYWWLDVPGIERKEVVVTPTLGNGTLRNRMKMFGTDSVPPSV